MKYRDLSEIQNTYPKTPETISQNYKSENGEVIYKGEFPENFLTFKIIPLDDINVGNINIAANTTFRFIVEFVGGEGEEESSYWTSEPFLEDLRKARDNNQPYFNRETVTLAAVDFQLLSRYWLNEEFAGKVDIIDDEEKYIFYGEKYAEVTITETIDTKEEMLKHIEWLVGSDEKLREVNTFGAWTVETTSQLGFLESEFTPKTLYDRTGAVDLRNSGAGDLRDPIGITGSVSDIPDDRSIDRNAGSGDLRDTDGDVIDTADATGGRTGR